MTGFRLPLVLALPCLCLCAPVLPSCSDLASPDLIATGRPIYYGTPDAVHTATVALTYGPGSGYFCSGTLITDTVVMSAGHCLEYENPSSIQIFFGGNAYGAGDYRPVSQGLIHPDYDGQTVSSDISLLRLATPAPVSVTPIPHLPAAQGLTDADEGQTTVDFSGFGVTETGTDGQKLHVEGTIRLVCDGPGDCNMNGNPVAARAFGYLQNPGGPCSGDSGGPAYLFRGPTEYVAGITSYGDWSCAEYGVSTSVSHYAVWIDGFITPEDCTNGIDDDDDGLVDCDDPECAADPTCPDACELAQTVSCGDTVSDTTVDGTYTFTQYSCLADGFETGPEKAFRVDAPAGTQITARMAHGAGGDLDFFLLPAADGSCDPAGCLDYSYDYNTPEEIVFSMPAGGAYLVVETWDNPTTFDLQLICGAAENCTNGVDDDGDGQIDCDDPDCSLDPACQPNACSAAATVSCGDQVSGDTRNGTLAFADYSCIEFTEVGPEVGYELFAPAGTRITADLTHGPGSDLDLLLLPASGQSCDPMACIDASMEVNPPEQIVFDMPAGGAYLVVETYENPTTFDLTVTCEGVFEDCTNGADDDGDGDVDCLDADCEDDPACESVSEDCENGADDDGDGYTDCEDLNCDGHEACEDYQPTEDGCNCAQAGSRVPVGLPLFLIGLLLLRRRRS